MVCLGAQGLGEELAICFASHGAKLILSARNRERLEVCAHMMLPPCCPTHCPTGIVKVSQAAPLACQLPGIGLSQAWKAAAELLWGAPQDCDQFLLCVQRVQAACNDRQSCGGAMVLPLDITAPTAELHGAVVAADNAFDGAGVDYLVHNAGQYLLFQ